MQLNMDDARFALAASLVDRSHELISDGWVKGTWYTVVEGTDVRRAFCILGALDLACDELFGAGWKRNDARDLAELFILNEADLQYRYAGKSIPGFNDPANRTHGQVLSVLQRAADRLWNLSLAEEDFGVDLDLSKYAEHEVEEADAQAYLSAVLA